MRLGQWIKEVVSHPKQNMVTIVLGLLVILLGGYSYHNWDAKKTVLYKDCLEQTAVTFEGQEVTFREAAVYVAYEEDTVEQQALVYDSEHTNKYWNLHIDGKFVRLAAKETVQQMLIHDMIFYQMAESEGIELTEEEIQALDNNCEDFWADLIEDGKEQMLGISKEDAYTSMERMAISQKYQEIYSIINNKKKEEYDLAGAAYKELLKSKKYKVNEGIWNKLEFGKITLHHNFY